MGAISNTPPPPTVPHQDCTVCFEPEVKHTLSYHAGMHHFVKNVPCTFLKMVTKGVQLAKAGSKGQWECLSHELFLFYCQPGVASGWFFRPNRHIDKLSISLLRMQIILKYSNTQYFMNIEAINYRFDWETRLGKLPWASSFISLSLIGLLKSFIFNHPVVKF